MLAFAALKAWRWSDERALDAVSGRLESVRPDLPQTFNPSLVENLPAPARRFFLYSITPGTPIRTVVRTDMHGQMPSPA